MSDLHEAAEAAKNDAPDWTPPEGIVAIESDEQLIPGGPVAKVKRIVVHPVLRMVAEVVLTCPRCKAEGADRDPNMIAHIAKGGTVRTMCSKCKLQIAVVRPEENRVVLADGPIPDQSANLRRILEHGKRRR